MKTQRSRFRMISLLLLCVFLATVFFCARQAGIFTMPAPAAEEAGDLPAEEELPDQPDIIPDEEIKLPEPSPTPESPFDTTNL